MHIAVDPYKSPTSPVRWSLLSSSPAVNGANAQEVKNGSLEFRRRVFKLSTSIHAVYVAKFGRYLPNCARGNNCGVKIVRGWWCSK